MRRSSLFEQALDMPRNTRARPIGRLIGRMSPHLARAGSLAAGDCTLWAQARTRVRVTYCCSLRFAHCVRVRRASSPGPAHVLTVEFSFGLKEVASS